MLRIESHQIVFNIWLNIGLTQIYNLCDKHIACDELYMKGKNHIVEKPRKLYLRGRIQKIFFSRCLGKVSKRNI